MYYTTDGLYDNATFTGAMMHSSVNAPLFGWNNTAHDFTSSDSEDGHPADNLANPSTAIHWQSTVIDDATSFHFSTTGGTSSVCIGGHNFYESGVTLALTSGTTAGNQSPIFSNVEVTDGEAIVFDFPSTTDTLFYLTITPSATNFEVLPQCAVVYAGNLMRLPRPIFQGHNPLGLNGQSESTVKGSTNGHFLGKQQTSITYSTGLSLSRVDQDWARDTFKPFIISARTRPFFYIHEPTNRPKEVYLVWLTGDPSVSYDGSRGNKGTVSISMDVQGIAHD